MKSSFRAAAAARSAGPKAPGSKEIPEGAPNCLEGLTFVFTGELESIGRDDAVELAKRYSGSVLEISIPSFIQADCWTQQSDRGPIEKDFLRRCR